MKTGRNVLFGMHTVALTLFLCLWLPGAGIKATAAEETVSVRYQKCSYDTSQKKVTTTTGTKDCIVVKEKDAPYTFEDQGWYAVTNTDRNIRGRHPVVVNGTANLVICDGAYWEFYDGIIVNEDATLNIYPGVPSSSAFSIEGTGEIIAIGNTFCAGIGGGGTDTAEPYTNNKNKSCGTVIIHGGSITASGNNSAGIGSGYFETHMNNAEARNGGTIVIYGGNVKAYGSTFSAGIGGGKCANGGTVRIYGGVVLAQSRDSGTGSSRTPGCGAGIGGGDFAFSDDNEQSGSGGDVEIYGGRVVAIGGSATWKRSGNIVPNSGAVGIGVGYQRAHDCYLKNRDVPNGSLKVFNGLMVFGGPDADTVEIKNADSGNAASGQVYNGRYKYMEIRSDDISYRKWDTDTNSWQDAEQPQGQYNEVQSTTSSSITWSNNWYVVRSADIDLSSKTVNVTGVVNLILCDSKSVNIDKLNIANDATLSVYGQASGTGSLTANSVKAPGNGKLIIHGGHVTASAKENDSSGVSCDDVTVYGGSLIGEGKGAGNGISGSSLITGNGVIVRGGVSADEGDQRYVTIQNGNYDRFRYMEVRAGTVPVHPDSSKHSALSFTIWDQDDRLPVAPGNYYLNRDVTLTNTWNVPAGTVNLCLNGNGIKMASGSSGSVIHVGSGANLKLYDCMAKEHRYIISSGMVTVREDNYTFTAYETFNGGYITKGNADKGAGVYVAEGGTFFMSGGTILGNKAGSKGGGVYVEGTFQLSGAAVIKENKMVTGDSLTSDNVYLATGKKITIASALTMTEPICLTMETPGIITTGWSDQMNNADPGDYFKYDNATCAVCKDGDELILKTSEASLTHNDVTMGYAYLSDALAASVDGDSITLLTDVTTEETLKCTANIHLTLDLNGYGIRMTNGNGSVIRVEDGILDLKDSSPNRTEGSGRPADIAGGYISGGDAEKGGGIYVCKKALSRMYGGTLVDNMASEDGGGVYAEGTFRLFGGVICANEAGSRGGGIYSENSDANQLGISGGTVTGNRAGEKGGGIYHSKGLFRLYEGTCSITGNTAGTKEIVSNVHLAEGMRMNLVGKLSADSHIGVTMETAGEFINDWYNFMQAEEIYQYPERIFTSDREEYLPMLAKYELKMVPAAASVTTEAGDTCSYYTFSEALAAWEDSNSLKLLKDVETESTIEVSGKSVALDLNGYGIRMTGTGSVIKVSDDAALRLIDSDTGSDSHKTHYITMTGGRGTSVSDTGSDDTISVTGGYITGGSKGGLMNLGTLAMSGGSILCNITNGVGGGIYNNGSLRLSGSPVITKNSACTEDRLTDSNVYLSSGNTIFIAGPLTDASSIGITMETDFGTFTSGSTEQLKAGDYKDRFASDNDDCIVKEEDKELKLHHVHRFTYASGTGQNADMITATCVAKGSCTIEDRKISIALNAPDPDTLTYDGTKKEAFVTDYPADQVENIAEEPDTITYYASTGKGSIEPDGSPLTEAPTNAGNYVAQVSWGGERASTAFTIDKAGIDVSEITSPTQVAGLIFSGSKQTLIGAGRVSCGTMYYALTQSEAKPSAESYSQNLPAATNAGNYRVWYIAKGDQNHKDTEPAALTVSIDKVEYSGSKTMSELIRMGKAVTNTVDLPALPEGAQYDASITVSGNSAGLISDASVNNNTLTYKTTSVSEPASASIYIPVIGATNYRDYMFVVTFTTTADEGATVPGDAAVTKTKENTPSVTETKTGNKEENGTGQTEDPGEVGEPAGKGEIIIDPKSKARVKVTNASAAKGAAEYIGPADTASKTLTIPDTVTKGGRTYVIKTIGTGAFKLSEATTVTIGKNVKKISAGAFQGSKVKTIIVKTKKLTKKSVKNSLKGCKSKKITVKVKVGKKKANKKYVKKYRKIFTRKNAGKKATVK